MTIVSDVAMITKMQNKAGHVVIRRNGNEENKFRSNGNWSLAFYHRGSCPDQQAHPGMQV